MLVEQGPHFYGPTVLCGPLGFNFWERHELYMEHLRISGKGWKIAKMLLLVPHLQRRNSAIFLSFSDQGEA